jgi:DNA repair protein SbcC/Rad50
MKFKVLTVRNFQCHKRIVLEFAPTITTLVGPTDAGKSALLRALRWTCLNDFVGSDFIREGAAATGIKLVFRHRKEDHTITRKKGERLNTYALDEKEFKSFATNVPEDITQALQLSPINFQSQHDSPFWFTESAGEVSRRLNAVVDLSVIDTVLSKVASVLREAESMVRVSEQRQRDLDETQKELEPQLERITHYEKLQEQNEAHRQKIKNTDRLASLLDGVGEYSARIQRPPDFAPIAELYQRSGSLRQKVSRLDNLLEEITEMEQTIERTAQESLEAALVFHKSIRGQRCPLCQNPI